MTPYDSKSPIYLIAPYENVTKMLNHKFILSMWYNVNKIAYESLHDKGEIMKHIYLEVENMGCVYKCHYISKEEFRRLIKWDHTYKHCPILIKQ